MPLTINRLEADTHTCKHTHTYSNTHTQTDDPHRMNFKKPDTHAPATV